MVIKYSGSPSNQSIHCGGNIGYASNLEITDSYHLGLINASLRGENCDVKIGGIVGDMDSGSKIERCYHIGDLIGSGNSDKWYCCCGGLTGVFYAQADILKDSFSIGNVSCSNINNSGSEYAGGIVGVNSNYNTHDNISRCYSVGKGKNGAELPSVGYNKQSSCNVNDCFYQSSASGTGNGRGVPKTEEAMKTASTFSGWDNSSVWSIEGGRYPILSGMSNPFTDYANISFAVTGDDSVEITGLTSGKTYALSGNSLVGGNAEVTADSNGKAAVSNITAGTLTVSSECTTVLGSVLSISKVSSPTGVGKVDCSDSSTNDGQLTGVSTDMEYKKSTDTSWTPCTATTVTGLAVGDYYVRMKHTTTHLASDYDTLSIGVPSTTPTSPPTTPTTPYVPSYDPPAPEPRINGGAGWNSISDSITKTEDGGTINIDMNGTTNFPGKMINTLQGKDVNVVLDMGNGIKWTINGKNITNPIGDINMGVSIGSSLIPVDVINNLTGDRYSMQIKLAHNGPFGFSATLTIPMRVQDAGLFANLFRYVKNKNVKAARAAADVTYDSTDSGTMEFMGVGKIADDGSVDLLFDGAPDSEKGSAESAYAIVVDDHSLDPSIVPEPEPEVLTLKATSKKGKVALSWNKLTGAKKYRIYQKIGKKYKMLTELKKKKFTVKKAYKKVKVKIKKKEKTTLELKKLTAGKEYTFVVKAFIDGKWTKVTKQATKKVKVKK